MGVYRLPRHSLAYSSQKEQLILWGMLLWWVARVAVCCGHHPALGDPHALIRAPVTVGRSHFHVHANLTDAVSGMEMSNV